MKKSFVEKIEETEYKDRVGAYAVIFDSNRRIAVIQTSRDYFMPGGGIENNETQEECIKNERMEEVGLSVVVKVHIYKNRPES